MHELIIDLFIIVQTLGDKTCQILMGFHAFTCFDSVSSFHGHGNRGSFSKKCVDSQFLDGFTQLGHNWVVSDEPFQTLPQLTFQYIYTNINNKECKSAMVRIFFC